MTVVDIREVTLDEAADALLGHGLDTPKVGGGDYWGFDLRGWAVGRHGPAERVRVRHAGRTVGDAAVGGERPDVADLHPQARWSLASGFFRPIGALSLDREFRLDVHVRLQDGSDARLAQIEGSRAPLETSFEPRLQPIGLTALGRTGSTAVTRLLASHPAIAAYRPFEYEPRVVTYWIDLLRELADPAAFRRQISPNGPLEDHWWLGTRPPFPRRVVDSGLQSWLGGESVADLAAFCQSRIDELYSRVAGAPDGATHFVEKLGPDTGALVRELYPRAREIFLVRDFRDMVASVFAYNDKRGFEGFGRGRSASDADFVRERLGDSVARFAHAWRTRGEGAHLMRYEDVVSRPRETAAAALSYLGLEASAGTLDGMLASLAAPESDVHRTTGAEDSIGRWRADLSAEVREACASAFGAALRQFGYEA
jgi:Sulfotransferase family